MSTAKQQPRRQRPRRSSIQTQIRGLALDVLVFAAVLGIIAALWYFGWH